MKLDQPETLHSMKYIFPVSFMANTFAMTAVMIALSLAGKPDVAADVGIVHAVTVALFHSFSANARSIILNPSSGIPTASVLSVRLLLVVPSGVLSFLLSTNLAGVEVLLAFVLVLRRGIEWVADIVWVLLFPINRDKGHDEPSLCWQRCLLPVDSFLGLADFLRTTNKGRLPRYAPCKL